MWQAVTPHLRLEVHRTGDRLVVRLDGELDLSSTPALVDVAPQLFVTDAPVVLLDLARVTFCDAAGIRMLITLHDHTSADGRKVVVGRLSRQLRRILDVTGLTRRFDASDPGRSAPLTVLSPHAHGELEEALDSAMRLCRADMGHAQLVDCASGDLRVVAHRGLENAFLDCFASGRCATACSLAYSESRPIFVEDVATSPIFADTPGNRAVMLDAGARAVASVPIVAADDSVVAVLSVHYSRKVHWIGEQERMLVELARATARSVVVSS